MPVFSFYGGGQARLIRSCENAPSPRAIFPHPAAFTDTMNHESPRNHDLLAIQTIGKGAEGLQAFEGLPGFRAGSHASHPLRPGYVPCAKFPTRLHRRAIERNKVRPAMVDLQGRTGHRRIANSRGIFEVDDFFLDEAMPVQGEDHGRIRARHGGDGDGHERQRIGRRLIGDGFQQIHAWAPFGVQIPRCFPGP